MPDDAPPPLTDADLAAIRGRLNVPHYGLGYGSGGGSTALLDAMLDARRLLAEVERLRDLAAGLEAERDTYRAEIADTRTDLRRTDDELRAALAEGTKVDDERRAALAEVERLRTERDALLSAMVRPIDTGDGCLVFEGWETTSGQGWKSTTPKARWYADPVLARGAARVAAGLPGHATDPPPAPGG